MRTTGRREVSGSEGLNETSDATGHTAGRTSIDDWIDDEGEDMEFENGEQAPQSPEQEYEPTTPGGVTVKQKWTQAY